MGWQVREQQFEFNGVRGRNIVGQRANGRGDVIIIGAHYDTRPAADRDPHTDLRQQWIEGANDGASGVAVLLELARVLEDAKLENNDVRLAFFDAEDRGGLDEWEFSVGAVAMAKNPDVTPHSVVVVDMIGDSNQEIFFDRNSDKTLRQEIWGVAADLGFGHYFIAEPRYKIIDDHIPFKKSGIPSVVLIDFDYPYWHTTEDTVDKINPESLRRVGRTLEVWLENELHGVLLEYYQTGGIAGFDDHLIVYGDGTALLTRFDTKSKITIKQQHFTRLIAQLDQAEALNALRASNYQPDNTCCDLVEYEIVYREKSIRLMDTAIPNTLQPLIGTLNEIVSGSK